MNLRIYLHIGTLKAMRVPTCWSTYNIAISTDIDRVLQLVFMLVLFQLATGSHFYVNFAVYVANI